MFRHFNWKKNLLLSSLQGISLLGLTGFTALGSIYVHAATPTSHQKSWTLAQQTELLESEQDEAQVLQVGIGGTPPFLIRSSNDNLQGIVLDVWEEIAFVNNFEYELILQTDTQEAIDAVARGELDLLVGPFSITADRLQQVNFTQPFFVSSLGVVLDQESPTIWSRVRPFFTKAALSSVGILIICLFVVGNSIWLAERKQNPEHFPHKYLHGVGNGMWFALVTLTTVGYGDRAPKTSWGRFIASTWMIISLIAVSSLIGGLASAFTLALSKLPEDGIRSPEDLQGTRMAVIAGTTGEVWAAEYRAKLISRSSLEEAINLVIEGKADGVVFDRPALTYFLSQNPDVPLRLADFDINSENFGFVLPQESPLAKPLDLTIVKFKEDGTLTMIIEGWLNGISRTDDE